MTVHDIPVPPPVLEAAPAANDDNPHVLVARYRKARKLADALVALGGGVESVTHLGTVRLGRQLAAQAAGTNVPSEITWSLVVELVRERIVS